MFTAFWLPRIPVKWACQYFTHGSKRLFLHTTPCIDSHRAAGLYSSWLSKEYRTMPRHHKSRFTQPDCETRLRVLLDLDQVLANFELHFLTKYKEKYPDLPFIPYDERNTFFLGDQYAILGTEIVDKVREVYKAEKFFLDLPEIDGSISAAKEMAGMEGVDVFICTSPLTFYRYCLQEKLAWVEMHLGAAWVDRTIITKDKSMVNGHLLIDDRPHVHGACTQPSWEHVVFSSNANRSIDVHGKRRLANWTDGTWKELIEDFKKRI